MQQVPIHEHQECALRAANLPGDGKVDAVSDGDVGGSSRQPNLVLDALRGLLNVSRQFRLPHFKIDRPDHHRFRVAPFGVRSSHRVQKRGQGVTAAG